MDAPRVQRHAGVGHVGPAAEATCVALKAANVSSAERISSARCWLFAQLVVEHGGQHELATVHAALAVPEGEVRVDPVDVAVEHAGAERVVGLGAERGESDLVVGHPGDAADGLDVAAARGPAAVVVSRGVPVVGVAAAGEDQPADGEQAQ